MSKYLFFLIFSFFVFIEGKVQPIIDQPRISFSVILKQASTIKTELDIELKNQSSDSILIPKNPRIDYISNFSSPVGNLIVELHRETDTGYVLFPRTADVDPGYNDFILIKIPPKHSKKISISLNGLSWNRMGFPPGSYRVRLFYHFDEPPIKLNNASEWVDFKIY